MKQSSQSEKAVKSFQTLYDTDIKEKPADGNSKQMQPISSNLKDGFDNISDPS